MGAWDKLQNGISNIGDGLGGFALDTLKVGREFGQFDFSDGLGILVDTVQEDLIGKALAPGNEATASSTGIRLAAFACAISSVG